MRINVQNHRADKKKKEEHKKEEQKQEEQKDEGKLWKFGRPIVDMVAQLWTFIYLFADKEIRRRKYYKV